MVPMPSGALMKSFCAGASGLRALKHLTREGGERAPQRISRTEKAAARAWVLAAVAHCTARTAAAPVRPVNNFAPSNFAGQKTTMASPRHLQTCGVSTMVSSALNRSAGVALDQSSTSLDEMEKFVDVAHKLADAAGEVIRPLFRTKIDILDKDDSSPVTIADRGAEHAMSLLIQEHFPNHGMYTAFGEEGGLKMPNERTEYVWVLDPIDGTKSFITGKPLFGILIALVHKGVPILGIIDQPILHERWVGRAGRETTLNGQPIASRSSTSDLKDAYLYTTSPHLFAGLKEEAFNRVRDKVKTPLYGCDCYAYGLLSAGCIDLVVESGLKPYDFLALVPVVEGAGGYITDWEGKSLRFWPNSEYPSAGKGGTDVAAAGSAALHKAALGALDWK